MSAPTVAELYRANRRPVVDTWHDEVTGRGGVQAWTTPARNALYVARTELELRRAEADDLVRFQWDWDEDYRPDSGEATYDEAEAAKLASGEWEALYCIVQVRQPRRPHDCPSCACEMVDRWVDAGGMGGIVVDAGDRHRYRREVERDLWVEARDMAQGAEVAR